MIAFNDLSPAENERLSLLAEECAEVIQAIMKIKRHGYFSRNPKVLNSLTNREHLEKEIGHVHAALTLLDRAADSNGSKIDRYAFDKLEELPQYCHEQPKEILSMAQARSNLANEVVELTKDNNALRNEIIDLRARVRAADYIVGKENFDAGIKRLESIVSDLKKAKEGV